MKSETLQKLTEDLDTLWRAYVESPDNETNIHGMEFLAHLCHYGSEVVFNSRGAAGTLSVLQQVVQTTGNLQITRDSLLALVPNKAAGAPNNVEPIR